MKRKVNHGTPLYDAIGRALSAARLEAPGESRKLCVILTDGEENASEEYTRAHVSTLIKKCEKQGWLFLYLGADHDVWAAGESLGIVSENRISFDKKDVGPTFSRLSENRALPPPHLPGAALRAGRPPADFFPSAALLLPVGGRHAAPDAEDLRRDDPRATQL